MRFRPVVLAGLLVVLALPAAAHARYNDCQPYAAQPCLLPFPDDRLTVKDPSTPTGRRVHLPANAMPVNASGVVADNAEYNRNDGFSPGGMVIVRIPGLDTAAAFARNRLVSLADMGRAFAPRQRVLLLDETTGRRQLIWSELDATSDPADANLLIHPGKNLRYGHRYVVVLRSLTDANGVRLHRPAWLRKAVFTHPRRYFRIFRTLRRAHVSLRSVYLTWNFTVISRASETGRLLHIRNDAFRQLGDTNLADGRTAGTSPKFTVDKVEVLDPAADSDIARRITGTLTVPCYLDQPGCPPGARFHYSSSSPDALPTQIPGNVIKTQFICNIPRAAFSAPARISLYGHGLLGGPDEVNAGNVRDMSQEHDFTFCATRWAGLADEDIGNAAQILGEIGKFPSLTDRLQQGVLDMLYLGRAMLNPAGFASDPAFRNGNAPLIDTSHLYYDGNSQGGIEGGITTAVAPDFHRAVLGVLGMDYGGLLLARSVDFDNYLVILRNAYPDASERPLLYDLLQQLWDRSEPDGYAPFIAGRHLPDTPSHKVLMHVAYGDHQVTDYAADTEARTVGAFAHCPALDPSRTPDGRFLFGIPCIAHYPFSGPAAIVYWDSGPGRVAIPPLENTPNRALSDPHGDPRSTVAARTQKSEFLKPGGKVIDVCAGAPCRTDAFTP